MRQAAENNHTVVIDGVRRVEASVGALRDEVARNYVDKVEFGRLEGRVKSTEDKVVVDGRVTTQSGYMGWAIKSVIGLVMTGVAALLFAKRGMHP